ncbi:MAG: hypothetical protein WD512_01815, partial [Candidatus Paceibacterota bacterium]
GNLQSITADNVVGHGLGHDKHIYSDKKYKEIDKEIDKDYNKLKSFEFSSDADHSTCSTITDSENSNVVFSRHGEPVVSSLASEVPRAKLDGNNSIDRIRPSLTLEDFICDNYENSTEVCRSAPVRTSDYTDSIKKIRSTNYFGSSKSIGKITRRTSCIIQDSFTQTSNNTPLNVRILPSKNK